jgi:hypothetical protein
MYTMALRIDWKRSLFFTAVIFIILWGIGFYIEDTQTYYIIVAVIIVAVLVIGNLVGRRR